MANPRILLISVLLLCGCAALPKATTPAPQAAGLRGRVLGGQQPITGATIQLYSVGTTADGSAGSALLTPAVTTGAGGMFTITQTGYCPTPTTLVYLVASGGNPGLTNGTNNANLVILAALGQCQTLSSASFITLNEVTTVAAVAALAPYITSPTAIGSSVAHAPALASAFTLASEYANTTNGSAPGLNVLTGYSVPTAQINTLANILAGCVNTGGGTAGDNSACGNLFTAATTGSAPTNTLNAALNILDNPTSNLVTLLNLASASAPFAPTLSVPPPTWAVALNTASPVLTLTAGALTFPVTALDFSAATQSVTLQNTGATTLTLNSIALTGANPGDYSLSANTCGATLAANATCSLTLLFSPAALGLRYADVAITSTASATPLYVALSGTGVANSITVSLSLSTVTLADGAAQPFTATVANDSSNSGVSWSLTTGPGSLASSTTSSVTYNAPPGLPGAGSATLTATSLKDPTKSASAAITLTAPSAPASQWVYYNSSGGLVYKTLTNPDNAGNDGYDQIMDFSTAGYNQGAGALPTVSQAATVSPSGDTTGATDTAAIQNALATVAALPLSGGFRGAVVLAAGNFYVNNLLNINASGVVLRGAGSGSASSTNTIINLEPMAYATDTITAWSVTSGTVTFTAANTLYVGETVTVSGFTGGNTSFNTTFTVTAQTSTTFAAATSHASGSATGVTGVSAVEHMMYPFMVLGPYTASGCSSSYTCYTASPSYGSSTTITDAYVPAGATTVDVTSTSGLSVGSTIVIERPVTQAWINFMGMNSGTAPIDQCSGSCSWISVGNTGERTDRTITAINNKQLTLDAPLSDSIDTTYTGLDGALVMPYTFTGRISQVGVENLRVIAPAPANFLVPPTPSYQLVVTYSVLNAWARNLVGVDTLQSIDIENYSKQLTISNVAITHTVTQTQSAKFMEFYIASATQILMDTVSDSADNMFFFSTSSSTQGPNVLRNATFLGNTTIEPHQRWATGLLIENTTVAAISGSDTSGGINLINRGSYGSGQGWAIGWGVAWNTQSGTLSKQGTDYIQQPPGAQNWCIGCMSIEGTQTAPGGSTVLTQGALDSSGSTSSWSGTYVFPASLYQAQLTQRLGSGYLAQ